MQTQKPKRKSILNISNGFKNVEIDIYSVMPNHTHFIITILADEPIVGAGFKPAPTGKHYKLSEIIRGFKTFSARRINEIKNMPSNPVFQRNYHEHIIRNDKSYDEIYTYIESNPQTWERDRNHPTIYKS